MTQALRARSDVLGSTPAHDVHSRARVMSETSLAKAGELVATGLLVVLLPRLLGPSGYGQFAVASATVSLAALTLGLGVPLAAVRYVPASLPYQRLAVARALATRAAVTRGRLLAVLTAAIMTTAVLVRGIPIVAAVAVCIAMWCSVGSSVVAELALAIGYRRIWNVRFALESALILCAAAAGWAAFGVLGAIVGLAVASAATFVVLSPRVLIALHHATAADQLPEGLTGYARLQTVSSLIFMTVLRTSPIAVAALGGSSRQVGYAAIASGLTAAGAGLVGSLMDVQLPRLSELAHSALAKAEGDAFRAALGTLALAVAFSFAAALIAPRGIQLALGRGFAGADAAVSIGIAAVPLATVSALASLKASLRLCPIRFALAWALGGAMFLVALAAAVPARAAEGAAMAVLASLGTAGAAAMALLGDRAMKVTFASALSGSGVVLVASMVSGGL